MALYPLALLPKKELLWVLVHLASLPSLLLSYLLIFVGRSLMLRLYREENNRAPAPSGPPVEQLETGSIGERAGQWGGNAVHFISLGCPRNWVDTEVMVGLLLRAGYEATPSLQEADWIVINTCGFLETARQESSQTIEQCLAESKPTARLIVTGCMVQNNVTELQQRFPKVHAFLGSGDVPSLLKAVEAPQGTSFVTSARSYLEVGDVPRRLSTPSHYAYLKIAEGCRKRCSFCIIPAIKGPLKSKSKEQVVREFDLLLRQGVSEVILIAQDLGDYGKEQGWRGNHGLVDLLKELLQDQRPFWLRLLYLYPDEIDDQIIELMASDERLCSYVDMPIQHIDDGILKAMRRTTSSQQICSIIDQLRQKVPNVAIRTSLMVGFPGETQKQFDALNRFVEQYQLDNVGVFAYSREKGSHADTLPDHLPDEVKEERRAQLMQTQQKVVKKKLQKMVGRKLPIVVEGYHPETQLLMVGRHQGQCPDIDGQLLIQAGMEQVSQFGQRHLAKISGVSGYDLLATIVKR